jgi:hypothetical protein
MLAFIGGKIKKQGPPSTHRNPLRCGNRKARVCKRAKGLSNEANKGAARDVGSSDQQANVGRSSHEGGSSINLKTKQKGKVEKAEI